MENFIKTFNILILLGFLVFAFVVSGEGQVLRIYWPPFYAKKKREIEKAICIWWFKNMKMRHCR